MSAVVTSAVPFRINNSFWSKLVEFQDFWFKIVTLCWICIRNPEILPNVEVFAEHGCKKSCFVLMGTYHSYSVPYGLCGQVAAELGTHHPAVAMSTCDFTPDDAGLVGFATRSHCVPMEALQKNSPLEQKEWTVRAWDTSVGENFAGTLLPEIKVFPQSNVT